MYHIFHEKNNFKIVMIYAWLILDEILKINYYKCIKFVVREIIWLILEDLIYSTDFFFASKLSTKTFTYHVNKSKTFSFSRRIGVLLTFFFEVKNVSWEIC